METIIKRANIVLPERVEPQCSFSINDGVFLKIGEVDYNRPAAVCDFEDDIVIPGLIDTHVHGAGGYDVMDAEPSNMLKMRQTLLQEGTVAFLPTTMSAPGHALTPVLDSINSAGQGQGAEILGVHLEGPFLSAAYQGAHAEVQEQGDWMWLRRLVERFPGLIRLITLAWEIPFVPQLVRFCLESDIIPSIGHSGADYDQMAEAISKGVRHVTHAFNAMPGLHHRQPGLLCKSLLTSGVVMELIADGVHAHPSIIDMAIRLKTPTDICLVSDGMRAMGMPDGIYELGGQKVNVRKGLAILTNGTLAGSSFPLLQGVRTLVQQLHYSLPDAICCAALNPARLLGVDHRLGSLLPGKEATFVRLTPDFRVKQVWVRGNLLVERS